MAFRSQFSTGGVFINSDHNFSLIFAQQQVSQSSGSLLKSFVVANFGFELSVSHQFGKFGHSLGNLVFVVEVDESLDDGPLDDDSGVVFDFVSLADIVVVLTDGSTGNNPAEISDMHQHLVQHLSSDVVEVHVDALGTVFSELLPQVILLVVYSLVSSH